MKDLFNQISNGLGGLGGLGDKLNGALGGQQKTDAPSGQGTGNALGDMVRSAVCSARRRSGDCSAR